MKQIAPAVKKAAPKNPEVKKKATLVDTSRSQNITICLRKIGLDPLDIMDAMETYNETVLTQSNCELLKGILPKKQENEKAALFTGNVEDLDESSQFILLIGGLIGYKERIDAIIFQNNFENEYELIMEEIDRFLSVFKWLKEDEKFKEWLTIIMAFGNYVNGGTFKGAALGFEFESLVGLVDVKNKNNKMNLLQYIVKFVHDNLKKEELFDIIPKLQQFHQMQIDSITEDVKYIKTDFDSMTKLKELVEQNKDQLGEEDGSEKFLKNCYEDTKKSFDEINTKFKKIHENYKELLDYFGQNPKTDFHAFIKCFRDFSNQLENANEWYETLRKEREREEKKKKRKF